MISYRIEVDEDQIRDARSLFEFLGGNSEDAIRIAINKTAPRVRTQASRAIRTQVRLKASYVNDKLVIYRATRGNLTGAIKAERRGLLLSRFSTDAQVASENIRWLSPPPVPRTGIRVKVKPSGAAQDVTGGSSAASKPFYMVLRNSRALGIAVRLSRPGPRGGSVKVLHGPSVSQVFNTVRDDVLPQASAEYQAQLLDAMRYLLAKRYPPEN